MFNLIKKDLKTVLSDPSALIGLFMMPIVITTILGIALSNMFSSGPDMIESIEFAVVKEYEENYDFDQFLVDLEINPIASMISSYMNVEDMRKTFNSINPQKMFFEDFLGSDELKAFKYTVLSEKDAKDELNKGNIDGIIYLPKNFLMGTYINFMTPMRTQIELRYDPDPSKVTSPKILEEVIKSYVQTNNYFINTKNILIEKAIKDKIDLSNMDFKFDTKRISVDTNVVETSKSIDSMSYYAAGMSAMFLLFTSAYGGYLLLEEKQALTYTRQIGSGVKERNIFISKAIMMFVIAFLQLLSMYMYSYILFKVDWGNLIGIITIFLASSFATTSLGMLIAVVSFKLDSYILAKVFENGLIQLMALLGGSYLPVNVLPKIIQSISPYVLNGSIQSAILSNMTGSDYIEYLIGIMINGVVFIAIGSVFMKLKRGGSNA